MGAKDVLHVYCPAAGVKYVLYVVVFLPVAGVSERCTTVEKSPSIKVHWVTDPLLFLNICSTLVRLLVKWSL